MSINQRSILGPVNPVDNGLTNASAVNGAQPVAPSDDQGSDAIGRHGDLTASFKSSYSKHGGDKGDGSQGIPLGSADSDYGFSTSDGDGGSGDHDADSPVFGGGGSPGKGIAGELPLVTRSNSDSGSGYGKTIG